MPNADRLVVRWTIGDVRARGFEMLRVSIACAFRMFGARTRYVVYVNSVAVEDARKRTGELPVAVDWMEATRADVPEVLRAYLDDGLIEGMGWKLAPLRTSLERYELALDNDCIVWDLPDGMRRWLETEDGGLLAEDVERCLGSFDGQCQAGALNAGIRGLAPGRDIGEALRTVLEEASSMAGGRVRLESEIEEQGLQAAAMCRMQPLDLVRRSEVSICSPFWPRSPEVGTCGAHFVGMNAHHIPWDYYDRPADVWLEEHWLRHRAGLYERAGLR